MLNSKSFIAFLAGLIITLLSGSAFSQQVHTFQIERDGARFECRVSIPRDTFLLLESIRKEFWMKNISQDTIKFRLSEPYWWAFHDETDKIYRCPDFTIPPLQLFTLKPGDSIGGVSGLERYNVDDNFMPVDSSFKNPYFALGKQRAFLGPDTIPFEFLITINQNSKKHLQIKEFYDFLEYDLFGKGKVDTTSGISFSFEGILLQNIASTNPTEQIYEFLETNKKMIGLDDPRSELKVNRHRGNGIEFQQEYGGVKVSNGGLTASISPAGNIFFSGNFHPEINIPAKPKIDSIVAIQKALRDLGLPKDYKTKQSQYYFDKQRNEPKIDYREVAPTASIIVLPREKNYYLVWVVGVRTSDFSNWIYYVDARSGKIIHKAEERPIVN